MLAVIMTLSYLDFDRSEDTLGTVTFDAMASVRLEPLPGRPKAVKAPSGGSEAWGHVDAQAAVRAEIDTVLAWAQAAFPGMQGPVEEGAVWDFDRSEQDDDGRVLLTLTLSGNADFAEAFERRFGVG